MSKQTNLANDPTAIVTSNENICIVKVSGSVRGGRSLDVTGYTLPVIQGGHIVIRETATDNYKPMPLVATNDGYAALPAGHEYTGFQIESEMTTRPMVGIATNGIVNPAASPYPIDATLLTALKAALPHIEFRED